MVLSNYFCIPVSSALLDQTGFTRLSLQACMLLKKNLYLTCTAPITRIQYVCNININQSFHSWLNPLLIDLSANMIWISGIKVHLVRHERERTRNLTDNSSFNWLTSRCTEQDWASERLRTDLYFESFLFLFVFETLFIYKIIGGLAMCVWVCVCIATCC